MKRVDLADNHKQKASGAMTYPKKGTLNRLLFKTPLILWRMGLGKILSHKALSGNKMLVLTSWGRKSKKPRHTMLSYVVKDEREYVCSGWGERTDWFRNILTNPLVTVQIGTGMYSANARRIQDKSEYQSIAQAMLSSGGDSHFDAWLESFEIERNLEDMVNKHDRLYIVAFDKSDEAGPPPLPLDLRWIWGLVIIIPLGIWLWLN